MVTSLTMHITLPNTETLNSDNNLKKHFTQFNNNYNQCVYDK